MKRLVKLFSLGALVMVLLSSCATTTRMVEPYYDFQGMADPGVIVITVDAVKEQALIETAFSDLQEFANRAERVSLALKPMDNTYPLDVAGLDATGVVQGDYPKWLINTSMMYAKGMQQMYDANGELEYFQQKDGTLSLYAPNNDKLLFSTDSYADAYASYSKKQRLIDLDIAQQMLGANIAIYVAEPETFFDLGLDLPASVITQAKVMMLLINQGEDGKYSLDAYITMDTAKLANTLSQMIRTGYLTRLKRDKVSFKIADLMQMFLIKDDLVTIKHMDLGDEQMNALKQSLTGML